MSALLARTARAEWRRIWTVRSSWVLLLATAALVLMIATVIGSDAADDPASVPADATAWDGAQPVAMFALFGMLALACVTATADHGTGGLVPTLQWTPRRGVLLAARVTVVVATCSLLGLLLVAAAALDVYAQLPSIGLGLDSALEVLGNTAFVLLGSCLVAAGLGLALRSTAGALVSVIGLVLVLPFLLAQLGYDWSVDLAAVMPGASALFLIFGEGPSDDMTATSARVALAAWALGSLVLGGWRLVRSDADR